MNKKDISTIKKGFKLEDIRLRIGQTFNSYCKMDGKKIIFSEKTYFESLDDETQELFIANFKKLLTGEIGTKIFELGFNPEDEGIEGQQFFYGVLNSEENFEDKAKELTKKILDEYTYETDILVSVISANYYMNTKNKTNKEDSGEDNDTTTSFKFIMCSINKIEPAKKTLKFDYKEKELKTESSLNLIINLNNPIEGFMFPTLSSGYSDVNKILYYTSKANQINEPIVTGVLNCSVPLTTKQENGLFEDILKSSIGNKVTPGLMSNIYEGIANYALEKETFTINTDDIGSILEEAGVKDISLIKNIVEDTTGEEKIDINVHNIIPGSGKSVKIDSPQVDISLNPAVLKSIKQTNKNGKKCLIIELDDCVNLEGFEIETEK